MIDKALFLVYNIIVVMSEDITGYMQTYRSGHNGADSKFFEELAVCSAKKAHKYRVFSGSKIKYFVVLSVSSFQKFLERMRNYIHGELSEWSKVQHSKCCVPKRNLGFESLTLRQKVQ